jgi:tetratricopeptide (TPR) repeat protein
VNSRRLLSLLSAIWLFPVLITGEQGGASPITAQDYLRRGEERAGRHDFDGAIGDYNQALRLKPDYAEAFNDRGHSYYWTLLLPERRISPGKRRLHSGDRIAVAYPNAFNNRGAAYMPSDGGRERAIADSDQALKQKLIFRYAYVNRANALGLRQWRRALDTFTERGCIQRERSWQPAAPVCS